MKILARWLLLLTICAAASQAAAELTAQWPSLRDFQAALAESPAVMAAAGSPAGQPAVGVSGQPAALSLPGKFQVVERVISLTNTFDIRGDGKSLGTIREKLISLTRSFDYKDADGRCVATAREAFLSWGAQVTVSDCGGAKIGVIKENVFKSLFKVQTTYSISDSGDRVVAQSTKVDWLGTEVTLRGGADGKGAQIAKLTRPWLQLFSDTWDVELNDAKAVDSRLIVMISAYKTAVDNARRSE